MSMPRRTLASPMNSCQLFRGQASKKRMIGKPNYVENRNAPKGRERRKSNPGIAAAFWPSLDHFVRSRQHIGWNRQADLLGGFQIDHQLKLHWLFHGQIGRLSTF